MTISYGLYENNLTSDPNDYMASVQRNGTMDLDGVIDRMIQRGSTVTKADALAVLQDYHNALESLLLDGFRITTPVANFGISIKGVFQGKSDTFDSSRHTITPTVYSGSWLKSRVESDAKVTKEEVQRPEPNLVEYHDLLSEEINGIITPGGMGRIVGHRLKYDQNKTDEGIFFVNEDTHESSRVEVTGKNKPGELIFMNPKPLAKGDYRIEVRARFQDDLRKGELDTILSVGNK